MECPGLNAAIDMIEDYTLSVAARLNTALQTGLRGQSQNTFEDFAPEWPFLQRIKTEKVDHARIMLESWVTRAATFYALRVLSRDFSQLKNSKIHLGALGANNDKLWMIL